MEAKPEHIQAFAEYFSVLLAIKRRCMAENAVKEKSALQGGSLFPNKRQDEYTP